MEFFTFKQRNKVKVKKKNFIRIQNNIRIHYYSNKFNIPTKM